MNIERDKTRNLSPGSRRHVDALTVPQERETLFPLPAAGSSPKKLMVQLQESLVQPCTEKNHSAKNFQRFHLQTVLL